MARRSRDLDAVEDALGDAFVTALERWPRDGVPARPEAWLLTAARRRLIDASRRSAVAQRFAPHLHAAAQTEAASATAGDPFPDERLQMLFACAHPAIDERVRAPLLLRAVLGIDAERIAAAFVVSPVAMRQRLVRAKAKIRATKIAFELPPAAQSRERLAVVLEAIYAAFGVSWDDTGIDDRATDLAHEALFLGRAVATAMPDEPETHGLVALMLFIEARRAARRDAAGAFVPLDRQDPARWSLPAIEEAERTLRRAGTHAIDRFQLEAAIQSAHAARAFGRHTDWTAVALLYDALVARTDALGARVARAAAHGRAYGNAAGLRALAGCEGKRVAGYQPYWAVRAELGDDPRDYERAIGLSHDPATRTFLRETCARRLAASAAPAASVPSAAPTASVTSAAPTASVTSAAPTASVTPAAPAHDNGVRTDADAVAFDSRTRTPSVPV